MADTQWPRLEVFLAEASGQPPEHVGSVHAPDQELALLNARNVFVRRPRCQELWVAPTTRILFRTLEEMQAGAGEIGATAGEETSSYLVLTKPSHRTPLKLACRLEASSPEQALGRAASGELGGRAVMWAAVPQAAVARTAPADVESFFDPALEKAYKLHSEFRTVEQLKEIRKRHDRTVK
jgi:ring-1,2-phenylacetyl-CoA epoxidase subunit PaaB